MPEPFSLYSLAVEVYNEGIVERSEQIQELWRRIPENHRETALFESLKYFMRQVIVQQRPGGSMPEIDPPKPEPVPEPEDDPIARARQRDRERRRSRPSPGANTDENGGVRGRHRVWTMVERNRRDRWLRAQFATADGQKMMADFTREDLINKAEELEYQKIKLGERAQGMRNVAKALRDYRVTYVRELPEDAQLRLFGGIEVPEEEAA